MEHYSHLEDDQDYVGTDFRRLSCLRLVDGQPDEMGREHCSWIDLEAAIGSLSETACLKALPSEVDALVAVVKYSHVMATDA